jgi:hypothetical protein
MMNAPLRVGVEAFIVPEQDVYCKRSAHAKVLNKVDE